MASPQQAFPRSRDGWDGMTLRDYFAGQALVGILAAEAHPQAKGAIPANSDLTAFVALNCYAYADAMLKARSS